ncbi:hypothetical protein E9549_03470 [Blastococcus sp. MG754426]|uniref:hypothetical protein n=1 Tax=unclassified Blastococcus TaxID=2619396 RepID=UPI001EEFF956|nr:MULTISPECIES: hypothetical protein [unclassified Blastococcus]MCF6506471.1 hypothetical protein [Blastococcus sp. MG754426]MCF6511244.1 hypothetical protein [Blastococcus sp. MG754427]
MRSRTIPLALSAALLAGCTSSGDEEPAEAPVAEAVTAAPEERLTVVADEDPVGTAVSTSRALFGSSDVAVLADEGDRAGMLMGASAAVAMGVPLLVTTGAETPEPVTGELDRLGTGAVLAVGDAALTGSDVDVVAVAADAGAVAAATGLDLADGEPVPADGDAAAVAALDPEEPAALRAEGGSGAAADPTEEGAGGELPATTRPESLEDTVVLASGEPGSLAGIATARAAGARVLLTGGTTDPRTSADVVSALGEEDPGSVVALGAGFAAEDGLDWKVETAATGVQLPGGGQTLFPGKLLVALYGHPGTAALGLMGEQPVEAAVERARAHAAPYEPLVEETVVPAFEIIATIASASAGPDGDYSAEADPEFLRPWVEAAGEAGMYVVLDLQPGRTDFVTQAELYRSLLELPHVGLALDPEWRLEPDQVHLRQIGSVDVEEVNRVVTWLADLTRENQLPQKLLVLHQFRLDMIPGRDRVDLGRDELAVMVHADGQGGQGAKQGTWNALRQGAPEGLWWGWKNFYDEDIPMLTPEQTISDVEPDPQLISYQ